MSLLLSFQTYTRVKGCRYEWELCQGNAPILRRVLEQDESPGRLMVLCVASIRVKQGGTPWNSRSMGITIH